MTLLPVVIALSMAAAEGDAPEEIGTPTATSTATSPATSTATPTSTATSTATSTSTATPTSTSTAIATEAASATPFPPPAAPAAPRRSPWALGTSLSGGWDSNPLAFTVPVDSQFVGARAWLGVELGEAGATYLQVRYDGTRFASLVDADLDRFEASAEQGWRTGRLSVRLVGAGALRVAGDPARSGWDAGARLSARLRLPARLALRAGGGYTWREAKDVIYSGGTGWVDAGLDVVPWRGASVIARWSLETGTEWVLASSAAAMGWRGGGGMGGGTTTASLALGRVSQSLSADFQQALWAGTFLHGGYAASFVRTDGVSRVEHVAAGGVGWAY